MRKIHVSCFVLKKKKKKFSFHVYIENVSLCFHSSANLSKNVPHIEGHPRGRNLLELWVQFTNVFG